MIFQGWSVPFPCEPHFCPTAQFLALSFFFCDVWN
jgi:hypothetical protein